MTRIATLGNSTARLGINDLEQIVGVVSHENGVVHAFLYDKVRGIKDLGSLGGPEAKSRAAAVNGAGLVVGYSQAKGTLPTPFSSARPMA